MVWVAGSAGGVNSLKQLTQSLARYAALLSRKTSRHDIVELCRVVQVACGGGTPPAVQRLLLADNLSARCHTQCSFGNSAVLKYNTWRRRSMADQAHACTCSRLLDSTKLAAALQASAYRMAVSATWLQVTLCALCRGYLNMYSKEKFQQLWLSCSGCNWGKLFVQHGQHL